MTISRRDLSLLLPALAAAGTVSAQDKKPMLPSKVYPYNELTMKQTGENRGRAVLDGTTHSGYPIEVHMTDLAPGMAPHPPHHHVHEEMLMLKNGTLDVMISGKTTRIGPGSNVYVASGEEHGWKNAGNDRAEYFVIAFGQKG